MIALSVVICARNPRTGYLRRVIKVLQKQSLPQSQWELLLIDNGSKQPLRPVWDLSWHSKARHVVEDRADHGFGLRRGIREAASSLLVLLDENCVLDSNYLSEAIRISGEWPKLDVWGSGAIGFEFEVDASERLQELISIVARRNVETPHCGNVFTCVEAAPPGPGLCVRANVADAYCKSQSPLIDDNFDSDGNFALDFAADELSYLACSMGSGIGVFPQLKLGRMIPNAQINERSFIQYQERENILRCLLNFEWKGLKPADPLSPAGMLSALKYILLERGVQRRLRLADLRATLKARHILDAIRPK
jgi:hypothetical protein